MLLARLFLSNSIRRPQAGARRSLMKGPADSGIFKQRGVVDIFKDVKVKPARGGIERASSNSGSVAVYALAGLNVAVCGAWQVADDGAEGSTLSRRWMEANLTASIENWKARRNTRCTVN